MTDASLAGKVAVVTGAGRGIGKSIALTFAKSGADVAICARRSGDIDAVREEIEALGRRCLTGAVDLADAEQTTAFCKDIVQQFEAVDILVNNAGAYLERGAFVDSDTDRWWQTMKVNVRGPYLMSRHLIHVMRQGGKIINLTSGKGFSAGANSSAYHVSKGYRKLNAPHLRMCHWAA